MKRLTPFLLVSLLLFCSFSSRSQDSTEAPKKVSLIALPLLFFTPETSLGYGAAGALNLRLGDNPESQSSQILFGAARTLFNQTLLYTNYNVYLNEDKYWLKGEFGYYDFFFFYYGIGPETRLEDEETYEVQFPRIKLDAMHRLGTKAYWGVRYWMDSYNHLDADAGGLIDNVRPAGFNGGTISGLGPVFILDTRDNVYSSAKGYKLEMATVLYHEALGSQFRYAQAFLDAAVFTRPWKKYKHVIGAQLLSENTWGDVPFFALPKLGGSKVMRGYYQGRFVDQKQMAAQVEYRFPLFWRLEQTLFTSASFIGKHHEDWRFDQMITAAGSGLRFVVNQNDRIKIRFDVAYGEEVNFYFTFNEAF